MATKELIGGEIIVCDVENAWLMRICRTKQINT